MKFKIGFVCGFYVFIRVVLYEENILLLWL